MYMKQSSNEEKMRVKPLTREIAESVRNDESEKVKPKDKDLQHKFLCGLHEVYSHIMLRPNLVYESRGPVTCSIVSHLGLQRRFNSSIFVLVIVSRVSCLRISQQIQTRLVL